MPRSKGPVWLRRLQLLQSISADEWAFVGRCMVALARTDLQLTLLPYSSWRTQLLKATAVRASESLDAGPLEEIRRLVWLFSVAVRLYPRPAACLHRSLCLHELLGARGFATQIRIGIRLPDKAPSADEEVGVTQLGPQAIEAHAWIEHSGQVLYDQADPRQSFEQMPL